MKLYRLIEFNKNYPDGYMTLRTYFSKEAAVAAKKRWLDRYSDPADRAYSYDGKTRQESHGPIKFNVISFEVESED